MAETEDGSPAAARARRGETPVESALDAVGAGVAVFGADNRPAYANASMKAFFAALLGENGEVSLPALAGALHELEGGKTVAARLAGYDLPLCENILKLADRWIRLIGQRRPDGALVLLLLDVTALKEGEGRLKAHSQEISLYRALLDELPVASFMRDEQQRMIFANRAYVELTGRRPEALLGLTTLDMYPEQGREFHDQNQIVLDTGELYEAEIDYLRPDGSMLPTITRLYRVTTLDDRNYLIGSITDTTVLKKREREVLATRSALEEVGSLLKDAVSSMSQGLLVVEDGKVVLSNETLSRMIAVPGRLMQPGARIADLLEDCIARGATALLGERHVEAREFGAIFFSGKPASLIMHSGRGRWLRLDVTPTDRGRFVMVFSDITDLKSREEELRQLVIRAETADRAKSEFLANMSHEIRTPMNGVLGMAELLAKSQLDTRQKTFIDIMVKSGNALLTIINDILDFSKIDAGQMVLRAVAFNPVEAIEDVAGLLSARAAEKDIELVVRGAANMPAMVTGDAGRFRQIVTNLIGNAVKFTDRGHVLIDLASHETDDGVEIAVRVEDTGAGIPPGKMDAIFEKFSQVDSSSTRRHEGTGLGLAITDGLVRLFGGTLAAESELGKGSVFTVRLPMARAAPPPRIAPARISGARLLVVDGHELSRRAAHDMLLEWGYDATAVGSPAEALAVLAAAGDMGVSVDAILVDYQPAQSPAFLRSLREHAATAGLSVIVLTSMNLSPEDQLVSSQDSQAHLMKPVRADLLRETVAEVLRARRGARTTPGATILPLRAPPPVAAGSAALDVLVAEDNEVNQILFTQFLMGTGLSFKLVENGEQAVEAFRASRPGMILMDVSMPVMNGLEASRAIRALESGSGHRVPIVAVTAHVLDGDREQCFSAGMDDYLMKPIGIDRLEEKLDRWLRRVRDPAIND